MKLPIKEFNFTFSRSSGAGGQNVNKVNSKATLNWDLAKTTFITPQLVKKMTELYPRRVNDKGEVTITSQRFRDQPRNIADCLEKLEEMLAEASRRPKIRRPTKPKKSAIEKRLKHKRIHSDKKKIRKDKIDF